MTFLIVAGGCVVGFVIGGMVGDGSTAALGLFAGLAIGFLFARQRALAAKLDALERRLATAPTRERVAAPAPSRPVPARVPATAAIEDGVADTPSIAPPPLPEPRRRETPRAEPRGPGPIERGVDAARRWFGEGNVPVKIGMLVLIAGVGALLKYASDQGWLRLPIELRLAAIALAAIVALAFGWRERGRRRGFALSVEGGAIGVLLMTVFAAYRLYGVLGPGAAFALMLVLVAGLVALAVLEDALALAVFGVLAGFAAPILTASEAGHHVALFSYYALLNLAIFAIAAWRSWRILNLLGFAFTYLIGTAWGVLRYRPALFDTTEPFLLLFFAIYLAIPLFGLRRRDRAAADAIDGTLVFGNPLVAFALHAVLLDGARMPLAVSALALGVVYTALAAWILKTRAPSVLGESLAVLAAAFATLAIPLALSARATACTFAIEGAALVWLGLRQERRLPRISGLLLQLLAAGAFAFSFGARHDDIAFANGGFAAALLIAVGAFASAAAYAKYPGRVRIATLCYAWALAWWLGAGLREIDRFVPFANQPAATLGWIALTAALAALAHRLLPRAALAWTAAGALIAASLIVLDFATRHLQPFAGWPLAAMFALAIAGAWTLHALREAPAPALAAAMLGWSTAWTAAAAIAIHRALAPLAIGDGWRDAATLLPLLAAWLALLTRPGLAAWPVAERREDVTGPVLRVVVLAAAFAFAGLLLHDGDASPLAYVPILNPIDLVQIAMIALAFRWLQDRHAPSDLAARRGPIVFAAGFAWITAATLRGVHQIGGVVWSDAIFDSSLAETALTIVWSVLGVIGWVQGSRRGQRALWIAGAALMAVVLAKLLLIDRTHLGNLFGIGSFIAYGLLCTVIGYFAPAPPRIAAAEETPA